MKPSSDEILASLRYHPTRKKPLVYRPATRQSARPLPLTYTVAAGDTPVVTVLPDGVETRNTARAGDLIVTGISGERYVLRPEEVSRNYTGTVGGNLTVAPAARMVARYTGSATISFRAPWGEDMVIRSGDYVVRGAGGHYRIARREFELTYEPIP